MRWVPEKGKDLRQRVLAAVGQDPFRCYQCGKCTSTCPMAPDMEHPPHLVMRLLQLGQLRELLPSASVWACVSCETCTARCPQGIEVARVMDAVRQMGLEEGLLPREGAVPFTEIFLHQVKNYGRLWDTMLGASYNLRRLRPFKDLGLAAKLLRKGKIAFRPERISHKEEVRRIFERLGGDR